MKLSSIKDYFLKSVLLLSALVSDDRKLTWKESQFLAECAYFNYIGGDLSDFKALSDYMLSIKFFNRRTDVSVYKTKLSNKKMVISNRGKFILPNELNFLKDSDDITINIQLSYVGEE